MGHCKGIESYYGPCGASDCRTCNPRTYRTAENPNKRKHEKCGCRSDFCKNCNPEYLCIHCGICFVDEEMSGHDPDDTPCVSQWERPTKMTEEERKKWQAEVLAKQWDDDLPF